MYFHLLQAVPAWQVVAHRVAWSAVLLGALIIVLGKRDALVAAFTRRRVALALAASAVLIAINWLLYIWAVHEGRVIAASLGYFLNPMLNVLIGWAVLRERLTRVQWLAIAVVAAGVGVLAVSAFDDLWIALTLAGSFALYGLVRKLTPVAPMVGLTVETLVLLPVALLALGWWASRGELAFGGSFGLREALLIASGAVTALPLVLFARAAQRLPLSTLGLVQYLSPTMQLLSGVFLLGEAVTPAHRIAFPLIWAGLAIYSWALWRSERQRRGEADRLADGGSVGQRTVAHDAVPAHDGVDRLPGERLPLER